MKKYSVLAVLVAGAFLLSGTVPLLANEGDWGSQSQQSPSEPSASQEQQQYQYNAPTETGSLPQEENPGLSEAFPGAQNNVSSFEVGGRIYRQGVDVGP